LTSVAQPHEEKGRLAADWLLQAIERGARPQDRQQREILPTKLVIRNSTAPPR
jgi:DNA-binding LacI/PurR family transcriptional regulator